MVFDENDRIFAFALPRSDTVRRSVQANRVLEPSKLRREDLLLHYKVHVFPEKIGHLLGSAWCKMDK